MKYKVGDRVKDTEFGEGIVVETEMGTMQTSILVQFDNENKKLHDGNGLSKEKHEKNKCCFYSQDTCLLKLIKPKQFAKSDLKDGDIVTLRNNKRKRVIGQNLISEEGSINLNYYINKLINVVDNSFDIIKVERRPERLETVFERKEEILDKAEKEYLSGVIRPFRNEVRGIEKDRTSEGEYYIAILTKNDADMNFPNLDDEDDYKGMEAGKMYSLEELEL